MYRTTARLSILPFGYPAARVSITRKAQLSLG